ncbi:enoyl-CoA hydratase/isomerase family protein [Roseibium sp. SCP14]|uniref:enoyl-CoA hydratase/isomerase family protein n=1 Tax=Roseibium sp. SCP14 TaxID=3141375 RepID=UPI00333C6C0C
MDGNGKDWVTLEVTDAVGTLTLSAPDQLNAIHRPMMDQLIRRLEDLRGDETIRAMIVTGSGRGFCAGAHVGEMAALEDKGKGIYNLLDDGWNRAVRLIRSMPKPVVSAVNGIAAGGGVGLALSADMVLAARSARFIQVFGPKLGVIPDVGNTWFLPQALGRAKAMQLMLTGETLDAAEAESWGLISRCVEDDELTREAFSLAHDLSQGPINAFVEIRKAVDHGLTSGLEQALDHERDTNARLCAGPDFAEGTSAFADKRRPDFTRQSKQNDGTER